MYVKIQNASRKRNIFGLLIILIISEDFLIVYQYDNFISKVVIQIITIKLDRKLFVILK